MNAQINTPQLEILRQKMMTCEQTKGQTILEHGQAVARAYKDIFIEKNLDNWYLPPIISEKADHLRALAPANDILEAYHVFHDCGKSSCITIDDEGKRHFPNHAMISAKEWLVAGGDPLIGRLIEHDMDMHTLKPAQASSYAHLDLAPALLLTAWAEINANSKMFGGYESTSFKIKAKSLTKLTKAFLPLILNSKGN